MIEKRAWHQPKLHWLDAGRTAQFGTPTTSDPGAGADNFLFDPNHEGDLTETSETMTAFGNSHAQADS